MAFESKRPKLELTGKENEYLTSLCQSRTGSVRSVERAKTLLLSYQGKNDSRIADELNTNRQKVIRCVSTSNLRVTDRILK